MEKTMSVEDRMRRAEEIYYRRKDQEVPEKKIEINTKVTKKSKKMIKQIIICLVIYGIFYIIINNNYVFSEDFTNKAKEILNQDIDFKSMYITLSNKMQELYKKLNNSEGATKEQEKTEQNQEQQEQQEAGNVEENIGGAEEILIEENKTDAAEQEAETTQLSQMEQDANYIKSTVKFIKPVEGKISSGFGTRNPTTATVPKNHTGTDIATETGKKIVSATDGTVILASSTGDYGKHLKIQNNDIVVVYAHCNNLYVNEGDVVKEGQEIAEVGSTGNATGPHLHFEIRYQNRYVDPQMVLEL